LALKCDGFVGAFNSNWVRLIVELKSTIRGKAEAVFLDVDPTGIKWIWQPGTSKDFNW